MIVGRRAQCTTKGHIFLGQADQEFLAFKQAPPLFVRGAVVVVLLPTKRASPLLFDFTPVCAFNFL